MLSKSMNVNFFQKRNTTLVPPSLRTNSVAVAVFILITAVSVVGTVMLASANAGDYLTGGYLFLTFVTGLYILAALKIADQWEKAVVLRFGKFNKLAGPGLFWIIPIVDQVTEWIDHRVMPPRSALKKP